MGHPHRSHQTGRGRPGRSLSFPAEGEAGWAEFVGLRAILTAGLVASLVRLAGYERWTTRPSPSQGPGTAAPTEPSPGRLVRTGPQHVALLIATGIGLHNFAEGLAIGQSAAAGQMNLAVLLVIGFALHNATEGFGIVGPLGTDTHRPGWGLLTLYGLIGGRPLLMTTALSSGLLLALGTELILEAAGA